MQKSSKFNSLTINNKSTTSDGSAFLFEYKQKHQQLIKQAEEQGKQLTAQLNNSTGLSQFKKHQLLYSIQENQRYLKTLNNIMKIN